MKKPSPYLSDYFARKAKKELFVARSVFKLEEINERFGLIKPHSKVLDLGASPGSWSQYCYKLVRQKGLLISVDLNPLSSAAKTQTHLFLQGDIFLIDFKEIAREKLQGALFDVVLSDMAPKTTGIKFSDQMKSLELCEKALDVALENLKEGGHFVCKLFHGAEYKTFEKKLREHFVKVHALKPKGTRSISKEIFFIAKQRKLARPDGFEPPTA